jgi:hypothetical protein
MAQGRHRLLERGEVSTSWTCLRDGVREIDHLVGRLGVWDSHMGSLSWHVGSGQQADRGTAAPVTRATACRPMQVSGLLGGPLDGVLGVLDLGVDVVI